MIVPMTVIAEKLCSDLLALPEEDRAELAQILLDSLAPGLPEDDPAFLEELARREENILSGKAIGIPAEEALARIEARLASRRR